MKYVGTHVELDELTMLDTCKLRHCRFPDGTRLWQLWFHVARQTDGVPDLFCVPVNLGGGAVASMGAAGHVWGLARVSPGVWQVAPSINVLASRVPHPGEHPIETSIWHQTPQITGMPDELGAP